MDKNATYPVKGKQDGLIAPSGTKRDYGHIPRELRTNYIGQNSYGKHHIRVR